MGFSVGTLVDYVDQSSTDLLGRLYFEGRSAKYFTVQTGIKTKAAIQLLAVTATAQADTACSFNASGTTTFTQRDITVAPIKYQDTLCPKDLRAKWTQMLLRKGSNGEMEGLTFEAEVANLIVSLIQEQMEVALWQGDTTSWSAYLKQFNGIIALLDTAALSINGNPTGITTGTGITYGSSGNVVDIVNGICNARTDALKLATDQVLFCGLTVFDGYIDTLIIKNYFHVDPTSYANYTFQIPGKNVTLVGVPGLTGTSRLFLGQASNFFKGADLESDEDEFRMWYSQDDDNLKYSVKFKMGTQVAYPSEVVSFKLV